MVIGSHLDSVPDGGAYDGPLGVVSAFVALRAAGAAPDRPLDVVSFVDEEGARFQLTTVAQPVQEQGRLAAQLLLDALAGGSAGEPQAPCALTVPTRLVVRATTAPVGVLTA